MEIGGIKVVNLSYIISNVIIFKMVITIYFSENWLPRYVGLKRFVAWFIFFVIAFSISAMCFLLNLTIENVEMVISKNIAIIFAQSPNWLLIAVVMFMNSKKVVNDL